MLCSAESLLESFGVSSEGVFPGRVQIFFAHVEPCLCSLHHLLHAVVGLLSCSRRPPPFSCKWFDAHDET